MLAGAAATSLAGVTLTGVVVFFTHESDPNWFRYLRGTGAQPVSQPSTGWSAAHSLFADAFAVVVLIGGAWFIARVSFVVFRFAIVLFVVALFAHVSGSVIRFNVVKLEGKTLEEAERGYLQIFTGEFEYLVTSRFELGPTAASVWAVAHLLTVVVIVIGAGISLAGAVRSHGAARPG